MQFIESTSSCLFLVYIFRSDTTLTVKIFGEIDEISESSSEEEEFEEESESDDKSDSDVEDSSDEDSESDEDIKESDIESQHIDISKSTKKAKKVFPEAVTTALIGIVFSDEFKKRTGKV